MVDAESETFDEAMQVFYHVTTHLADTADIDLFAVEMNSAFHVVVPGDSAISFFTKAEFLSKSNISGGPTSSATLKVSVRKMKLTSTYGRRLLADLF